MCQINYNKVICLEDYSNPDLRTIIGNAFKHYYGGSDDKKLNLVYDSKQWETAMSIRALRDFGILNRDSIVLGVGAGTEVLSYYFTNFVRLVFVTDRYLDAGIWSNVAPVWMLTDPGKFAPYPFEKERMVVQHMDGRILTYPDNIFDGIFSSGSIEHFGGLNEIANASFEMGRVLKPGGILSLSTEFKVTGPPEGKGWSDETLVLTKEEIMRYIVEASGLELVDELDLNLSVATVETQRDLASFLSAVKDPQAIDVIANVYPNLVLSNEGYVFCSAHLTLRKPDNYPVKENIWAAPSELTQSKVEREKLEEIARMQKTINVQGNALTAKSMLLPQEFRREEIATLEYQIDQLKRISFTGDQKFSKMSLVNKSRFIGFFVKTFYRFRHFGRILLQLTIIFDEITNLFKKIYKTSKED